MADDRELTTLADLVEYLDDMLTMAIELQSVGRDDLRSIAVDPAAVPAPRLLELATRMSDNAVSLDRVRDGLLERLREATA